MQSLNNKQHIPIALLVIVLVLIAASVSTYFIGLLYTCCALICLPFLLHFLGVLKKYLVPEAKSDPYRDVPSDQPGQGVIPPDSDELKAMLDAANDENS